jgi:hypothetical protein
VPDLRLRHNLPEIKNHHPLISHYSNKPSR